MLQPAGIFMLYPLVGRLWCSICPFMVSTAMP